MNINDQRCQVEEYSSVELYECHLHTIDARSFLSMPSCRGMNTRVDCCLKGGHGEIWSKVIPFHSLLLLTFAAVYHHPLPLLLSLSTHATRRKHIDKRPRDQETAWVYQSSSDGWGTVSVHQSRARHTINEDEPPTHRGV